MNDNTALPAGHSGNCQDPAITFEWILQFDTLCPDSLEHLPPPANNTWVVLPFVSGQPQPVEYTYQGAPDIPPAGQPDYQGRVVVETFGPPTAGGIFTLGDLNPVWRMSNGINTPDEAAAFLWSGSTGTPATFTFDAMDQFVDAHGTFDISQATMAFTPAALQADKCGFSFEQTYECNGNELGTADLFKRLKFDAVNVVYDFQVKKDHDL